jgi:hypothetical protein
MLNLPPAVNAYQHARHVRSADRKRRFSAQAPQPERLALKQSLTADRGRGFRDGLHQTARAAAKVDTVERLIHLERPRLACLRVHMIPVIQAKRHVAILLNLERDDTAAQRVNRPSGYEDGVARFRMEARDMIRHGPVS